MSAHWLEAMLAEPLAAPEVATTMRLAFVEAEARRAEREAARAARAEVADERHVYELPAWPDEQPWPPAMYAGTSIGALYGLPGCEGVTLDLGDWTVAPPGLGAWVAKEVIA